MMDHCIHKGEGAGSAIDEGNEGGGEEHSKRENGDLKWGMGIHYIYSRVCWAITYYAPLKFTVASTV